MDVQIKRYRFSDAINNELKPLFQLDNWHGLLAVMTDYLVIMTAIALSMYSMWFYPITWLVIGARQRGLSTILHESVHAALAKNKTLNHALGAYFSGYLLFQSFSLYVDSHIKKHHAFLGHKDIDPDYKYQLDVNMYGSGRRIINWKNPIQLLWTYCVYIAKNRMGIFVSRSKDAMIGRLYWLVIFLTATYFGYLAELFLYWIIPLMSSFLIIGWYLELAEHYPMVHNNDVDLYMTRNRFSSKFESLFFSIHNENYHLIHHLKPRLPFWNLEKAHVILMQDENYRNANETMGGVFISANNNQPVIQIYNNIQKSGEVQYG